MRDQADHYSERAMDMVEQFPDALTDMAWAQVGTSAGLAASGQWSEIERRSGDAVEITRILGDLRRWEEATANLGLIRTIYGRFDDPEDGLYMPVLEAARKRGVRQTEGWGLTIWGMNMLYKQRFDVLDRIVEDLAPWYENSSIGMDVIARLEAVDLLVSSAQRHGDEAVVRRWLDEGFALMANMGRPTQYRVLPAVYLFTEAVLDWWRDAPDASERRLRARRVRAQLRTLASIASIFPIGVPRLAWLRGRQAWIAGRRERALHHWRLCHERALPLEMAYDSLLSSMALARFLPDGEEREAMREQAEELSEEMGVPGSRYVPEA